MVKKSFKLTYKQEGSGPQSVVMDVTPELTFGWLVQLTETEFGINGSKQKFKMGLLPKILKMELNKPLMVSAIKNDAFYSYLACSEFTCQSILETCLLYLNYSINLLITSNYLFRLLIRLFHQITK